VERESSYRLVAPVAAYVSAKGTQIEGNGITPKPDVTSHLAQKLFEHYSIHAKTIGTNILSLIERRSN
jgi:hypothetical protein